MTETKPACVVCQISSDEVPLVTLTYQDRAFYICPQHLPILIHHPADLADYLPGAENFKGAQGH